ncbi:MAG: F0F1-type ATP synthase assembly protein I [Reinekea sp.]|jgi:F0F1-type ATP synthase assembly protein I
MPYFKPRVAAKLAPPATARIAVVQMIFVMLSGLVLALWAPLLSVAVVLGGSISVVGQCYYNYRALRYFGSSHIGQVVAATKTAMVGKWAIIIGFSLACVIRWPDLNPGLLYSSLFISHTLGALLLPLLVANKLPVLVKKTS